MRQPLSRPPFFRLGPAVPEVPVVLSVPHAGRDYSPELLAAARLPKAALEMLEDRLSDRLVWRSVAAGATAFVARIPRAEIDLNRDPREIDPALVAPPLPSGGVMQSARARNGLGLIPSRVVGLGPIWRGCIDRDELNRRIEAVHQPYHDALEQALELTKARFGAALLLDCHSMPPRAPGPNGPLPPVVFGDRHGTTAAPELVDAAAAAAEALGYPSARNVPYAGGYVAARHGRPQEGVHALQIEIDRSSYLDAGLRRPGPGFDGASRLIAAISAAAAAFLLDRTAPETLAAE